MEEFNFTEQEWQDLREAYEFWYRRIAGRTTRVIRFVTDPNVREEVYQEVHAQLWARLLRHYARHGGYPVFWTHAVCWVALGAVRGKRVANGRRQFADVSMMKDRARRQEVYRVSQMKLGRIIGRIRELTSGLADDPARSGALRVDFDSWYRRLSGRSKILVSMYARGHGTREVAEVLSLSETTVNHERFVLYRSWRKYQVS